MHDLSQISVFIQLLLLVVFMNRYVVGLVLKGIRGRDFDAVTDDFEPTVAIIVPMYNEGRGIYDTVESLLGQRYPADKLQVVVVDDCSTDDSLAWAKKAAEGRPQVRVIKNPVNMGKRRGISRAVRLVEAEIIVSVDSDVVVDDGAVAALVRRFVRPEIAAVGGRVHVRNADQNWLTRMQAIKYFIGYEFLKNTERAYNSVMCLSGCLTAYRRHVLIELEPILERREICGIPIKYGEDRFLTRQIVRAGYQTTLTLEAVCYTEAPPTISKYFSQQLRWRRSNIVDYMGGMTHAWKLHPVIAVHYLAIWGMLCAYPLLLFNSMMNGNFLDIGLVHIGVLGVFGAIYQAHALQMPAEYRVHPLNFVTMAFMMPVTYVVLTPLAVFTLDSGNWETRGHTVGESHADRALLDAPAPDLAAAVPAVPANTDVDVDTGELPVYQPARLSRGAKAAPAAAARAASDRRVANSRR